MRRKFFGMVAAVFATWCGNSNAAPLTVCDFENYAVGTEWVLWRNGDGEIASTAKVEIDPANPNNKVLHIVLKDWGCHPEFVLPT